MKTGLPQLIPREVCLKCDICCRYPEQLSPWAPFLLKEETPAFRYYNVAPEFIESYGINIKPIKGLRGYCCPLFKSEINSCSIYEKRPFDCRLYPFLVSYNKDYTRIILVADRQCPFVAKDQNLPLILKHAAFLKDILEKEIIDTLAYEDKGLIMPYNENFYPCFTLDRISQRIFGKNYALRAISIKDKETFEQFLRHRNSRLFSHTFEYIYSWQDIAHILWTIVDDNLLVFWKQGDDFFLLLPPLAKDISFRAIETSYQLAEENDMLTIENATRNDREVLRSYGFQTKKTSQEYIYRRESLVSLRGNRFKSQRWAYNYSKKNFEIKNRRLKSKDIEGCLDLYVLWVERGMDKYRDRYYHMLIEDNFFAQRRLMLEFKHLEITGEVVEINDKIVGYSFGYPIDKNNFCIFAEVTDHRFKGISEYLSKEFCRNLSGFKLVNSMDDSGIENIKHKKLTYHPLRINPVYSCKKESC